MSRVEPNRNVYVGHRYVPKIFGEWDKQNEYEGLSIVTHKGTSYTSKKRVPVGIDILNEEFWVVTGNYNAQVEQYRDDVNKVKSDMVTLEANLQDEMEQTKKYVDNEVSEINTRLNDLAVNVNLFQNFDDAVEFAKNNNVNLDWGNKNIVITQSIPNFHDVKHLGNGSLTINGEVFHLNPENDHTNVLYVRSNGDDNNFGLSQNTAFKTIDKAFSVLQQRSETLQGNWKIDIGGGRFTGVSYRNIKSIHPIQISGVDVDVNSEPVTKITDGDTNGSNGFFLVGMNLYMSDIKFIGYNRTLSASGMSLSEDCTFVGHNIHAENCTWGITSFKNNLNVHSGIFTNCGYTHDGTSSGAGIRSMMASRHHIGKQNNGSREGTVQFIDCSTGFHAQEGSTGHCDWSYFNNCSTGINCTVNSRVNTGGCLFEECSRGIASGANSHVLIPNSTEFVNCGNSFNTNSGAQVISPNALIKGLEPAYNQSETILKTLTDITVNTNQNNRVESLNIGTNYYRSIITSTLPPRKVGFKGVFEIVGSNASKFVRLLFMGVDVGLTYGNSVTGFIEFEAFMQTINKSKHLIKINVMRNDDTQRTFTKIVNKEITEDALLELISGIDGDDHIVFHYVDIFNKM